MIMSTWWYYLNINFGRERITLWGMVDPRLARDNGFRSARAAGACGSVLLHLLLDDGLVHDEIIWKILLRRRLKIVIFHVVIDQVVIVKVFHA